MVGGATQRRSNQMALLQPRYGRDRRSVCWRTRDATATMRRMLPALVRAALRRGNAALLFVVMSMAQCAFAQAAIAAPTSATGHQASRDLEALLVSRPDDFRAVLAARRQHRLQVLLAEPVAAEGGRVTLRRSRLGDARQYFYPASTVKLGAAVAALLELQRLSREQGEAITLDASWRAGPRFAGDPEDPPWIRVADDLRAMLIVSDNPPYNRCFELLSQKGLNDTLWRAGLASARMWHRLSEARTIEEHRVTRQFAIQHGDTSLSIAAREAGAKLDNEGFDELLVGTSHLRGEQRIEQPMSFAEKNAIALEDLQDLLAMVVRPDIDLGKRGFPELSVTSRAFLIEQLGAYPRESPSPKYDEKQHPDAQCKFLLPGLRRVVRADSLRVYAKIGQAYGFAIENSYVENIATGRGFFVAAVIYVNADGCVGDDRYDYESVADPFFAVLGEVLARAVFDAD